MRKTKLIIVSIVVLIILSLPGLYLLSFNNIPQNRSSKSLTSPIINNSFDNQLSSTINPLPKITIPVLNSLNNFYTYYDPNLDATFLIPNGWIIKNDNINTGMSSLSGVIYKSDCKFDLDFYKNPKQCIDLPASFDISFSPPNSDKSNFRLSLNGPLNGFGGSCGSIIENSTFDFYQVPITINGAIINLITAKSKIDSTFNNSLLSAGSFQDCYNLTEVSLTGTKSIWNKFIIRHSASDQATFTSMMQILENIKFH